MKIKTSCLLRLKSRHENDCSLAANLGTNPANDHQYQYSVTHFLKTCLLSLPVSLHPQALEALTLPSFLFHHISFIIAAFLYYTLFTIPWRPEPPHKTYASLLPLTIDHLLPSVNYSTIVIKMKKW